MKFENASLDNGAYRTVIGLPQLQAYAKIITKTSTPFKKRQDLLSVIKCACLSAYYTYIFVLTPKDPSQIKTSIVQHDVPFLTGIDALHEFRFNVLKVQKEMESVNDG